VPEIKTTTWDQVETAWCEPVLLEGDLPPKCFDCEHYDQGEVYANYRILYELKGDVGTVGSQVWERHKGMRKQDAMRHGVKFIETRAGS